MTDEEAKEIRDEYRDLNALADKTHEINAKSITYAKMFNPKTLNGVLDLWFANAPPIKHGPLTKEAMNECWSKCIERTPSPRSTTLSPEAFLHRLLGEYAERHFGTPPDWISLPKPFYDVLLWNSGVRDTEIRQVQWHFYGHSVRVSHHGWKYADYEAVRAGRRIEFSEIKREDGEVTSISGDIQEWRVDPSIWETL